jgi:hypothetical protein
VQRNANVPHPFPTALAVEAHALGSGREWVGLHPCRVSIHFVCPIAAARRLGFGTPRDRRVMHTQVRLNS